MEDCCCYCLPLCSVCIVCGYGLVGLNEGERGSRLESGVVLGRWVALAACGGSAQPRVAAEPQRFISRGDAPRRNARATQKRRLKGKRRATVAAAATEAKQQISTTFRPPGPATPADTHNSQRKSYDKRRQTTTRFRLAFQSRLPKNHCPHCSHDRSSGHSPTLARPPLFQVAPYPSQRSASRTCPAFPSHPNTTTTTQCPAPATSTRPASSARLSRGKFPR